MTLAIILVVAALVALTLVLRVAIQRNRQGASPADLSQRLQPIDVEAFRNLVDPEEDDFLRLRLPPGEFRRVRRARLQAVAAYTQAASHNAAILVRIGEAAQSSPESQVAEAGRELAAHAIRLRRNTALALVRIYVALALPNSRLSASPLTDTYEQMHGSALLLGRLQTPGTPARFSVAMR